MYLESHPIILNMESVTNTIPRATINKPDIMDTTLRCLFSLLRSLEKKLKNSNLNRKTLLNKINLVIKVNNIEFIGLNAEGLTDGIMMCLK